MSRPPKELRDMVARSRRAEIQDALKVGADGEDPQLVVMRSRLEQQSELIMMMKQVSLPARAIHHSREASGHLSVTMPFPLPLPARSHFRPYPLFSILLRSTTRSASRRSMP